MHSSDEDLKPMAILPPQTRKKGPIYKKDRNGHGANGGVDNTFYGLIFSIKSTGYTQINVSLESSWVNNHHYVYFGKTLEI